MAALSQHDEPGVRHPVLPETGREGAVTLAERLRIPHEEKPLPREVLYLADELFFTGTAAEITPIRSVDRQKVGAGARGPVTAALQQAFFDVIGCRGDDEHGWLTFVPALAGATSGKSR